MDVSGVVGAISEVFSWIGFLGAVALGLLAVIVRAADGTWVPVRAFVLRDLDPPSVRWFGDRGTVGEAALTSELRAAVDESGELDVFVHPERPGQARLHRRSRHVRPLAWGALAAFALGCAAVIVQMTLLALR